MKKVLKTILGILSFTLIFGGFVVFNWQYFRNKQLFNVLLNNSVVQGSLPVLQKMALAVLAIIVGLIVTVLYIRLSASIRKETREKNRAAKEKQAETERTNRELKKEVKDTKAENKQLQRQIDKADTLKAKEDQ